MSIFTEEEASSLQIKRMILHVVGDIGDQEIEAQEELPVEEAPAFFVQRILSSATSPVHRFAEGSQIKRILTRIVTSDDDFVGNAYELSRLFAKDHFGSTADGAFFVIFLGCSNSNTTFVCLIKYDYREAVELIESGGKPGLRQIVQAFVADRSAVQKTCIARAENGVLNALVSASDRSKKAPDLTHYFESFLDVTRDRTDSDMSLALQDAIRVTLTQCKSILPNADVPMALGRVKDTLRGKELVGQQDVEEAVFAAMDRPDDLEAKSKVEATVARQLRVQRLSGIEFRPNQSIFQRGARRKIVTAEGVEVRYRTGQEGTLVEQKTLEGGGHEIIIRTSTMYAKNETLSG